MKLRWILTGVLVGLLALTGAFATCTKKCVTVNNDPCCCSRTFPGTFVKGGLGSRCEICLKRGGKPYDCTVTVTVKECGTASCGAAACDASSTCTNAPVASEFGCECV